MVSEHEHNQNFSGRSGVTMEALCFVFMVFAAVIAFSGCTLRSTQPSSIVVIVVESLGFGSFSCGDEATLDRGSGFRTFCEESVRFTHAYTPSMMSQATMASIVTGQQPYEHGVRHNGGQGLSGKAVTAAEVARDSGFRTSFFSGGPPIWRKSGINQGFEVFDDNIQLSINRYYRPARDVVGLFMNWLDLDGSRAPFFSMLFLSDLQFVDVPTVNELGELRESSYRSQIVEVDDSLGKLVRALKARKAWDNTHVFLVGVNGYSSETHADEARAFDLFSEATRVTLMIKPARKSPGRSTVNPPESAFNWKIDLNVGLADLGATLFDLLGAPIKKKAPVDDTPVRVVSLKGVIQGPQPDWTDDRMIMSESAWAAWRGMGDIRYAIRKGPFLYLHDAKPQLFDTLTDTFETAPLPSSDPRYSIYRDEFQSFLQAITPRAWHAPDRHTIDKIELGQDLWHARAPDADTLKQLKALSKRYPDDEQLLGWRALWALRLNDWAELKAISGKAPFKDKNSHSAWAFVAARNLNEKMDIPDEPCFAFLKRQPVLKGCAAEGLSDLLTWKDESQPVNVREKAMEVFLRSYAARVLATRVAEANFVTGLTWDTSLTHLDGPDALDLVLALPEMRKANTYLGRRLSGAESAPGVR